MSFADRYARLGDQMGAGADPDDPAQVLAMPLVLRIEKSDPPLRRALLEAAARASILLCLDERSDPDGPWGPDVARWCQARIRKISRRARGAHWTAAQDVAGLTVGGAGALARAIVPGPVGEVDRRVERLQIGGTDVDGPLDASPPGAAVTLWLNPDLAMTVGKAAAQVGHGAMTAVRLFGVDDACRWHADGCPLDVAEAAPDRWADLVHRDGGDTAAVRDAGFTEVAPGSVTVVAQRRAPDDGPRR